MTIGTLTCEGTVRPIFSNTSLFRSLDMKENELFKVSYNVVYVVPIHCFP